MIKSYDNLFEAPWDWLDHIVLFNGHRVCFQTKKSHRTKYEFSRTVGVKELIINMYKIILSWYCICAAVELEGK